MKVHLIIGSLIFEFDSGEWKSNNTGMLFTLAQHVAGWSASYTNSEIDLVVLVTRRATPQGAVTDLLELVVRQVLDLSQGYISHQRHYLLSSTYFKLADLGKEFNLKGYINDMYSEYWSPLQT